MSFNLNQAHWAAMPAANVDWAALAQQWIQMRETLPPDQLSLMPDAPPPPMISNMMPPPPSMIDDGEKGEAPMEVERDDEEPPAQWSRAPPTQPWQNPPWQVWENQRPPPLIPELQGYTNSNKRKYKQQTEQPVVEAPVIEEDSSVLDAAKRKKLPAWIREGLEKMEREKQREIERQHEEEERTRILEEKKRIEAEALKTMESSKFMKSKFVSIWRLHYVPCLNSNLGFR